MNVTMPFTQWKWNLLVLQFMDILIPIAGQFFLDIVARHNAID